MQINKRVVLIAVALVLLLSSMAFATKMPEAPTRDTVPEPTMVVSNGVATCKVRLLFPGKDIDATLELTQGGTPVASWSDEGYGYLMLSGTTNVTSGVTYTLTVYGTVDGVSFTPASITVTP